MRATPLTTVVMLACASSLAAAEDSLLAMRTWRDSSRTFRVQARAVGMTAEKVELKSAGGKTLSVPVARLSADDRAYLDRHSTALSSSGPRYLDARKYKVRMGVEVTAKGGPVSKLAVTFPLPVDWPEQQTKVVDVEVSPKGIKPKLRTLQNAVQQVEFRIARLNPGQKAHVIYTLEVLRRRIEPPAKPLTLRRAQDNANFKTYLAPSPFIETSHPTVRKAADSLQLDQQQPIWKQVEAIYDWTRERVKHGGLQTLKGALHALEVGEGDCEERTSLFVAMCRLKGIPARSVWIRGHAYAEFRLQDEHGVGLWLPCESLGERSFGGIPRYDLVLQKGDNFRLRQQKKPQRYVSPTMTGVLSPGSGQPVLKEIKEQLQ